MKTRRVAFPQEIFEDIISHLQELQRRGIRSVYLDSSELIGKAAEVSSQGERGDQKVSAQSPGDRLAVLEQTVRACTDCALHESRTQAVFGAGNPRAEVMFIGEAPGRDEDLQGKPFVGKSGQLLTKILEAIELKREDVYITNIVKSRPPQNRDPLEEEVRACEKYLISQIDLIRPRVICALGRISAQWLLDTKAPLATLRGTENHYRGIPVIVTYHPAALLRNPQLKRGAWEDFKKLKSMIEEGRGVR